MKITLHNRYCFSFLVSPFCSVIEFMSVVLNVYIDLFT